MTRSACLPTAPSVGRVPDNGQQPSARVVSSESRKPFQRASIGFLDYFLCALLPSNDPTGEVIGRIQVRQKELFETRRFSHLSEIRRCVFYSHANNGAYFNGFGFTLNNRRVATKKSGTKKMAKTVAESIPPMVPVPIAF
jgi:hypothetical protein